MKKPESEEKQLDLGLKQSPFNNLFRFKRKVDNIKIRLNTRQYTKSVFMWFVLTISLSLIGSQVYLIQLNMSTLPSLVPILTILTDTSSRLLHKEYIYLLPATSILILISTIILSSRLFTKERDLSNTSLFVLLISILVITLALLRLINTY
jgi:hypothetical protein